MTYAEIEVAEKSLTQLLFEAGYRHEPTQMVAKRRIINIATGEVIGNMDCVQAVDFLASDRLWPNAA